MNDYIIGCGATLAAGEKATITPTALHAQVDAALAASVRAAAIDFEGTAQSGLARLLIVVPGWNSERFEREVTSGLLARGTCSFADVVKVLSGAAGSCEVHLFSRWLPDGSTCRELQSAGVSLVTSSLESIGQAAVVSQQRHVRWPSAA